MRGNGRAPVMTHHRRLVDTQRVENADHVSSQIDEVVAADVLRCIRFSIPTHVGSQDAVAGQRQPQIATEEIQQPAPYALCRYNRTI